MTPKHLAVALAAALGTAGLAACDRGGDGTPDAMDQTGEVRTDDVQPREAYRDPTAPGQAGEPGAEQNPLAGADGTVSEDQLGGMQLEEVEFGALDEDGTGFITQEEAENLPLLAENFERYDTSGDGRLDESEFAVFLQDLQDAAGQEDAGDPPPGGAGTTPGHTGIPPDRRVDGVEPEAMEPGQGGATGPEDRGF